MVCDDMQMKAINGFPNYAVTRDGDVYRLETMKKLKPIERNGYFDVRLYHNGRSKIIKLHRLVAEAYIPNPFNYPCVNHKDENKANNRVENLEWCTYRYNNFYGKNKPVNNLCLGITATSKAVCQCLVDGKVIAEYVSAREASRQTGINQSNIVKCCLRKDGHKTCGGYVWKYTNDIHSAHG